MMYIVNEMTWPQVEMQIKEVPAAILPLGSTEQHGYHLPLGTDVFLAQRLAEKISEQTGALVLPSMNFGYSWVWRDRVGTVSLRQQILQEVLKDIVKSVERYGVKVLVILNGHEANSATMKYAIREIQDETAVKVIGMFYPGLQDVYGETMESPTWGGMFHACEFETSLMLAVREELVHMEKAVKEYPAKPILYGMDNTSIGDLSESGTYGDPTVATQKKGEVMLEQFVRNGVDILKVCLMN
ncbi:MAG: creatininase family protein [Hespellia sp.]|nr:creatininase family protein [Hespellia sp.]